MFVTRWSVSVVIVFPFLGVGFSNIPPTFLISCEVQASYWKTLKYSEQYIRDHLSGARVIIWIFSEYDAFFIIIIIFCIALCNLTKSFIFSFISFLSHESDSFLSHESFKQSTCTLCASEILLFKVFINARKLTGVNSNWLELFPLCLTFSEFIVSICNRLNLIINTVSLIQQKFSFTLTAK